VIPDGKQNQTNHQPETNETVSEKTDAYEKNAS
jgi:hypothetical protein